MGPNNTELQLVPQTLFLQHFLYGGRHVLTNQHSVSFLNVICPTGLHGGLLLVNIIRDWTQYVRWKDRCFKYWLFWWTLFWTLFWILFWTLLWTLFWTLFWTNILKHYSKTLFWNNIQKIILNIILKHYSEHTWKVICWRKIFTFQRKILNENLRKTNLARRWLNLIKTRCAMYIYIKRTPEVVANKIVSEASLQILKSELSQSDIWKP